MGSPALPVVVFAQGFEFEQVGDQPIDAQDLDFAPDGALWAIARELYRLQPGATIWEEVYDAAGSIGDHILAFSADTLLRATIVGVHRSLDTGQTWINVYSEGGALFAADHDGPNQGVILSGEQLGGTGIAYSTDRGASFTSATFTVFPSTESTLHSAVEIPDGPAEGRLVAGCFNGIFVSEDGGRTWAPSSLFQDFRYWIHRVVIGEDPSTGARRLYATMWDSQASGIQLYTSDDDGLTWTNVPGMVDAEFFVFVPDGEGTLLAVEDADGFPDDRLEVWRSIDGGQTWTVAGELPAEPDDDLIFTDDMLIGPDGHVYIAVGRTGPEEEWVYRSTESVVVASEPEVPPAPTAERLVVYPNPAADRISVQGIAPGEEITLYDVLGRAVLRSITPTSMDVSALPPGMYVVRARAESQLITIRR